MGAKHILVVEDEEVIRETLRFNLVREGYQVSQASNGIEALEKARELRPDLIVLDLMLPELGGLEVCRILRQETTTPVLVLSARDSELDKIVGLRVGADDYMTKPFSLAELTARVKDATDLLDEIHLHVANIGKKLGADTGKFPPRTAPAQES